MRNEEEYTSVNEFPFTPEVQELIQYMEQLQEEIMRLKKSKRRTVTKWNKDDQEIKKAIEQCAIERKGYNRTVVPASTMHRWVKQYINSKEGQHSLKQNIS